MRYYWETSAVNYLAKKYEYQDAIATSKLQLKKGNEYFISPVTIWEILLIKDKSKREEILFYSQHLFNEKLLPSPSEILLDYFTKGCPRFQNFKDFSCKSNVGKVWKAMCKDKNVTYAYDENQINEVTSFLKSLSKIIKKIILDPKLELNANSHDERLNIFVNTFCSSIFKNDDESDLNIIRMRRLSVLLTFHYLCLNIDITSEFTKKYWNKISIDNPYDRLIYISEKHPEFFQSGPIWVITNIVYFQTMSKKKINRGAIHDGLHCVYLPFVDYFITNDIQFKEFKSISNREMYKKIYHLNDLKINEVRHSTLII